MKTKRVVAVLIVIVLAALFLGGLRGTVFPRRFDVPSIATTPQYQDPTILARAWALPVARTYDHRVVPQSNGSVCGPASLANVFRSLGDPDASSQRTIANSGLCRTGYCIPGLTLDELAAMAQAQRNTTRRVSVVRDITLDEFRGYLRGANGPARRYVVNFQRGLLFGKGAGHHSPIAGYLEEEDLVLVLDVNAAFGPWLVSSERLFRALDSIDDSSGKKRGLLVFE